jgi:gas vesicle protein
MDETSTSGTSSGSRPRSTSRQSTSRSRDEAQESTTGTIGTRGMVDRVKEGAAARLEAQKDRATEGLNTVAEAVRKTTETLRSEQHDTAARFVGQAADQLQRLSTQLRQKDVTELVDEAARLARRQPAIFVGLSFAAGLLTARFLKSSQERAMHERYSETRPGTYGGYPG